MDVICELGCVAEEVLKPLSKEKKHVIDELLERVRLESKIWREEKWAMWHPLFAFFHPQYNKRATDIYAHLLEELIETWITASTYLADVDFFTGSL